MDRIRRTRGRHRAGAARAWPVGWRAPVDPWDGHPLFSAALTTQTRLARFVTCGRSL